ncbi:Panacea domain-containing protein [Marinomonas communis]|uniref:Putative phage-associated protein n=1 Tax=Marinomonas communis TaxID=28254 RepID=A0A4R6WZU8_9GAMM|nr:type II toxin-antitoxin system antitoxin SocA domain-containing protein [Marinomonas communis]TDR05598.1 putative phage-associated protein [Marinomonas communis]
MATSTIDDVATYLIQESNMSLGITHRELQKILYYSQGFYLAKYNRPLFDADFDAWKYGPVNTGIWGRFKQYGYANLYVSPDKEVVTLDTAKKAFLVSILSAFLSIGQTKLIGMSHTDHPWENNYIEGMNKRISKEQIQDFFINFDTIEEYVSTAEAKLQFSKLIQSRGDYLNSLPDLEEGWISGNKAVPPTAEVCRECNKFLQSFERNLFSKHAAPVIPKLIMGPVPSGGVGVELHSPSKNIYINFYNDALVDVSIETSDEFTEHELNLDLFNEEMGLFLEGIV